jgi:hypothetical protein
MLEAKRISVWRTRYDLLADGVRFAEWDGHLWRGGGSFELDGRHYDVTPNLLTTKFQLKDQAGAVLAQAERVGRKRWTMTADGRTYRFERESWWPPEETLMDGDNRVGYVRRTSVWRSHTLAELPGLPFPLQVFVLTLLLTTWDAQAAG